MNNKVKTMVIAGLLTALAIIIPVQFGFLKVYIPPFTATLGSHLPTMLAMLISPTVAIVVGIGSALGFLITGLPGVIVARALMHAPIGYIGARIVKKEQNYKKALIVTAPIHGILEAIAIIPFGGNIYQMMVVVAIGTILHHTFDAVVSFTLSKAVAKANRKNVYTMFSR